jgi:DNA polymerase-3 subunit epsilon
MVSGALVRPRLWWKSRGLSSAAAPALKRLLDSQRALLATPLCDLPILALDLEMTGLNPLQDQILSIGVVPIDNGMVNLAGAASILVEIDGSVGQSAAIHGITDRELAGALPLDDAMAWLLEKLEGRIALAHHAPLDLGFIREGIRRVYGAELPLLAIDTLQLERNRLLRGQEVIKEGSLRLGASRGRYGLPVYHAHNALTDALACAELFLAQLACMGAATQSADPYLLLCD